MMTADVATLLYSFWSSFGIPAYPEYNVPDEAQMPYITYQLVNPSWESQATTYARLWYRDTSFIPITKMIDKISQGIGSGVRLIHDNGFIVIYKDSQFVQFQPYEVEDSNNIKVAYLSLIMETNGIDI